MEAQENRLFISIKLLLENNINTDVVDLIKVHNKVNNDRNELYIKLKVKNSNTHNLYNNLSLKNKEIDEFTKMAFKEIPFMQTQSYFTEYESIHEMFLEDRFLNLYFDLNRDELNKVLSYSDSFFISLLEETLK